MAARDPEGILSLLLSLKNKTAYTHQYCQQPNET